ncbi:hypothetical protein [Faecalibacillus intestinalis]|uniref:hypothetical protein n=1 Tax=Faecalibacillus intestinalis TaxID=1982626 RepID=UPI0035207B92
MNLLSLIHLGQLMMQFAFTNKIQESTLDFIESTNYEIYYTFSAGILDFYSHPTASYIEIMKWTEFCFK